MRQPGNEFKIDPFKAVGTVEVPAPVIPSGFQEDHKRWVVSTALARQHKFCANVCLNFTAAGGVQASEQACLQSCFTKYSQAFDRFQEEKTHFFASLADLTARGEDKYAAREI